ncbi:MAG: hypothetical protein IPJ84_17540 [Bdellovibrionales bacterium]|nr:hypothetical protein [Bdellovibrionales bacterium]
MKRTTSWKDSLFENGIYKIVSLVVTLILWVTILGRRDFVLTKDMDVEFFCRAMCRWTRLAEKSECR